MPVLINDNEGSSVLDVPNPRFVTAQRFILIGDIVHE